MPLKFFLFCHGIVLVVYIGISAKDLQLIPPYLAGLIISLLSVFNCGFSQVCYYGNVEKKWCFWYNNVVVKGLNWNYDRLGYSQPRREVFVLLE